MADSLSLALIRLFFSSHGLFRKSESRVL